MKVFGIGLNKTGTSTLGAAGELLGLRGKTWDPALFHETMVEGRRDRLWEAIEAFDLFNDFPYPLLYPEIADRYPDAKFILTRRASPEIWLASIKSHSMRASPSSRTHRVVYGLQYPHGYERSFLDYYSCHNAAAREFFAGRGDAFLEICWEEESDLTRLAEFLGRAAPPAPQAPLPCANARAGKMINPLRFARNCGGLMMQTLWKF